MPRMGRAERVTLPAAVVHPWPRGTDLDAHADAFGWDFDDERYERVTSSDYRCERCSDVASSIEAHGFCLIAPRELIDAHEEFVAMQNNGRRVEWMKRDGVFHPVVTLEAAE